MGDISQLASQFQSSTEEKQLQLIPLLLEAGDSGLEVLMEFLRSLLVLEPSQSQKPLYIRLVAAATYQALYQAKTSKTQEFIQTYFPDGFVPLKSERNIDYSQLQNLLVEQDFQSADSMTREKLCELAGEGAIQRKWLYFTEVEKFPSTDLSTINRLWWVHSQGKFGFGVQRQIWLSLDKDFSKLWVKIGWKTDNIWTRYPQEFTWNLNAPKGHLPLSNQLRGVRVISSLLSHPVWTGN
jgi:GUN4-like/ARM-like repeat domain, GUN4-N terminal